MSPVCQVSGESFEVSQLEASLRQKLNAGEPTVKPMYRIRHLGAFWQHWSLYPLICEKTGKSIVSALRASCPYPVWHKTEWVEHANPPSGEFDLTKDFFPQAWELFQTCPIPHTLGAHSENCEYTDDWWFSKDCYLCHSGYKCQDLKYCYRVIQTTDSQFCVFTFETELCVDVINSENCFESVYLLNCKQVQNSAFLYDCRNCQDCMFCFNLRNKQYCFGNQQLTKDEFEKKKAEWDLTSRSRYLQAQQFFREMMKTTAWHRAQQIDQADNATGDYLKRIKDCQDCFFFHDAEECANTVRSGVGVKTSLDFLSNGGNAELCYQTIGCGINAYEVRSSLHVYESKFCDYSIFLERCEHCFACCGLVGKKYHIFNKAYPEAEYHALREKIITHMKQTGEWGQYFPGYFSPNSYDESWSGFHFPLAQSDQEKFGYRYEPPLERKQADHVSSETLPDRVTTADVAGKTFWDEIAQKPFQVQPDDVEFAEKLGVTAPYNYYIRRMQENFAWLHYDGELRATTCGKSGTPIQTSWPATYDGRILCEEEYLKVIA